MFGDNYHARDNAGGNNGKHGVRTRIDNETIPPGGSWKIMTPLLSGLLSASQPHWIPLKLAPIIVELEISPLVTQYLDNTT